MPYPRENPVAKHDFLIASEDELPADDNPTVIFDALDNPIVPSELAKNSVIYTYSDGPHHPGPISRSITVVGLVDMSSRVIQTLLDQSRSPLDRCTIGVKKLNPSLPEKDKINSSQFARFVLKLMRSNVVAILSKDKYGRFGILRPMMAEGDRQEEKCAADCFVGDIGKARALFDNKTTANSMNGSTDNKSDDAGLWKPPGGEDDEVGRLGMSPPDGGGGFWQPPGSDSAADALVFNNNHGDGGGGGDTWQPSTSATETISPGKKRSADEMENGCEDPRFHTNTGAAAADAFYSGLTRTLDTRSESRLYHMVSLEGVP